jgi:hypothetical protein
MRVCSPCCYLFLLCLLSLFTLVVVHAIVYLDAHLGIPSHCCDLLACAMLCPGFSGSLLCVFLAWSKCQCHCVLILVLNSWSCSIEHYCGLIMVTQWWIDMCLLVYYDPVVHQLFDVLLDTIIKWFIWLSVIQLFMSCGQFNYLVHVLMLEVILAAFSML